MQSLPWKQSLSIDNIDCSLYYLWPISPERGVRYLEAFYDDRLPFETGKSRY